MRRFVADCGAGASERLLDGRESLLSPEAVRLCMSRVLKRLIQQTGMAARRESKERLMRTQVNPDCLEYCRVILGPSLHAAFPPSRSPSAHKEAVYLHLL